MMNIVRSSFAVAALFAAAAFSPSAANAETVGAYGGNPAPLSDAYCYSEAAFGVVDNCDDSTSRTWEVGLPVGAAGHYSVGVTVTYQGNAPKCEAVGATHDGRAWYYTSFQAIGHSGEETYLISSRGDLAYVESGGYLYAACHLLQGDAWYATDYNWVSN